MCKTTQKAKPTKCKSPTTISLNLTTLVVTQKLHSFIQKRVSKRNIDLLSLLDWIEVQRTDSSGVNWFDVLVLAELQAENAPCSFAPH